MLLAAGSSPIKRCATGAKLTPLHVAVGLGLVAEATALLAGLAPGTRADRLKLGDGGARMELVHPARS